MSEQLDTEQFDIVLGYLEAEVLCFACDGTIWVGCDYQAQDYEVNVGEAYLCGQHADKASTCTCQHSEQTFDSLAAMVEESMLERSRNGDDHDWG